MNKMFGDRPDQFAQLRNLNTMLMTYPGKKLLFMGGEFGQYLEWRYQEGLEWSSLSDELNAKMLKYNRELNHFYLNEPALWQLEQEDKSVKIIDADNRDQSVLSFIRQGKVRHDFLIVLLNFTPVQRDGFKVGVPYPGTYKEVLNSSRSEFGGDWTAKPQEGYHPGEIKDFDYQISVTARLQCHDHKPDQVTIKRKRSKETLM